MKNVYDTKQLVPIEASKFIESYEYSKASQIGIITIFGDVLGRSGDTGYFLKQISIVGSEVKLEFENAIIRVINPRYFFVNEMMIAIKECDKIIWDDTFFGVKTEYILSQENKIAVNVITGEHTPRIKKNEPCFILATW
jgi:hypothetical protein